MSSPQCSPRREAGSCRAGMSRACIGRKGAAGGRWVCGLRLSVGNELSLAADVARTETNDSYVLVPPSTNVNMKRTDFAWIAGLALLVLAVQARAQVAGSTTIGVAVAQVQSVALGWSAKKQIIGRTVYNEAGEKVGRVDDLIVTPDDAVSFAIVGVGGFIGVNRHHVAIPVGQLLPQAGDFVLAGATKAAIKALPAFDYQD
jgi:hypothetical protein